jgi:tetratricopeptide (TPR) repeat protein
MRETEPAVRMLVAEVERQKVARDPRALADALSALVKWIRQGIAISHDEAHSRWLSAQSAFEGLDLSIWQEDRTGVDVLALALVELDFYRQVDLSVEQRLDLFSRIRALLSPSQHLVCARVDLERAALLSRTKDPTAVAEALTLCDDAFACVEQLDEPVSVADSLLMRAHVLSNCERERDAIADAERARKIFAEHDQTQSLANVCLFMAEVHLARSRVPEAVLQLAEAMAGYERAGDSVGKAFALKGRAETWRARGKRHLALRDCQEAVRLLDIGCMRTAQGKVMLLLSMLEGDTGHFEEARRALQTAVEYLRESPEPRMFTIALLRYADLLRRLQDVEGACAQLDEAERECALDPRSTRPEEQAMRPRVRLDLLLELCRIAKELPTPDKPRIRKVSAAALELARGLKLEEQETAARAYLSYAG